VAFPPATPPALHTTKAFAVPDTVAANCNEDDTGIYAVVGETVTTISDFDGEELHAAVNSNTPRPRPRKTLVTTLARIIRQTPLII
jgi:hypothetical protein